MTRFTILLAVLAFAAGCTTSPENRAPAGATADITERALSPSGAPMGRDTPTATYQQPVVGPERRIEPPPPPRRP